MNTLTEQLDVVMGQILKLSQGVVRICENRHKESECINQQILFLQTEILSIAYVLIESGAIHPGALSNELRARCDSDLLKGKEQTQDLLNGVITSLAKEHRERQKPASAPRFTVISNERQAD